MKTRRLSEGEYKILTNDDSIIQKTLNQWKHTYKIEILGMCSRNDQVTYLIYRIKRSN